MIQKLTHVPWTPVSATQTTSAIIEMVFFKRTESGDKLQTRSSAGVSR